MSGHIVEANVGKKRHKYNWEDDRFSFDKKRELNEIFEEKKEYGDFNVSIDQPFEVTQYEKVVEDLMVIIIGFELLLSKVFLSGCDWKPVLNTDNPQLAGFRQKIHDMAEEKHSKIHKSTKNVDGMLTAIANADYKALLKIFYRNQHQHSFDEHIEQFKVKVYIDANALDEDWISNIRSAITSINEAAPGLHLSETTIVATADVRVTELGKTQTRSCYTQIHKDPQIVHLGSDWPSTEKKGTAIHELLHCLGFIHEFQREDAKLYLQTLGKGKDFDVRSYGMLTRFDPFSIMMYPETRRSFRRKDNDSIWNLFPDDYSRTDLSELDKVSLNLVFPPCLTDSYTPKIFNGMLYCGRNVMGRHNQVIPPLLTAKCGNSGPNCPACRVIKIIDSKTLQMIEYILKEDKWQGLSGMIFCGRRYETKFVGPKSVLNDGICGPNQGRPCKECGEKLIKKYNPNPSRVKSCCSPS